MSRKLNTPTNLAAVRPKDMEVSVALIDDPEHPSRENFDQLAMEELITSVRDLGLLQPPCVAEKADRYVVLSGHRRMIAVRALGYVKVRVRVFPAGTTVAAAVQVHENAVREALNAAEEAQWWWELLERECSGDTNKLADLLKLSREHVERRLSLKTGDPDVFAALGQQLINAAVAEELNRIKDRTRRVMYLDAAVRGGATRALVRQWRTQGENFDALQQAAPVTAEAISEASMPAAHARIVCELCDQGVEVGGIEMMYVHRHCRRSMIDRLLAVYQAQREQSNSN